MASVITFARIFFSFSGELGKSVTDVARPDRMACIWPPARSMTTTFTSQARCIREPICFRSIFVMEPVRSKCFGRLCLPAMAESAPSLKARRKTWLDSDSAADFSETKVTMGESSFLMENRLDFEGLPYVEVQKKAKMDAVKRE